MAAALDQQYYTHVPPNSVSERLLITARNRIYRDFIARMRPSDESNILDVGVSDIINDGANVIERTYPNPRNITACGVGAGGEFQNAFPDVRYLQIERNTALPFPDRFFEIATSNAVLEHVGSHEHQLLFVRELCRVARKVFISVPNRLFPVEHHTAIPIAHYQRKVFDMACRMTGQAEWAREENLILMTRKLLWRLVGPVGRSAAVGYTGLQLGPFSSNLYLAVH